MKKILLVLLLFSAAGIQAQEKIRQWVDTIGFANTSEKMDFCMKIMNEQLENELGKFYKPSKNETGWKAAISPHDDYAYVQYLYPYILSGVTAKTVIIFGVAHKAKQFNIENKIVFDSYTDWYAPYGNLKVSSLREDIVQSLSKDTYIISDSLQGVEHSVEAIVPFLQYYNKDVEIISILVPYMPITKIEEIAGQLSSAINNIAAAKNLVLGKDYAFVISNDAVHYGDEGWGGNNYAKFGADTAGYYKAINYEMDLINNTISGKITKEKIELFSKTLVKEDSYRDYLWTWCGRYSVPLGLMTVFNLGNLNNIEMHGMLLKYSSSISTPPIPVEFAGMGVTAPANIHHWVGYACLGYK